jgi:hypothetical protein
MEFCWGTTPGASCQHDPPPGHLGGDLGREVGGEPYGFVGQLRRCCDPVTVQRGTIGAKSMLSPESINGNTVSPLLAVVEPAAEKACFFRARRPVDGLIRVGWSAGTGAAGTHRLVEVRGDIRVGEDVGQDRSPGLARPAIDRHDGDIGGQLATTTDGHPRSEPIAGITGNTKTRPHTDCKSAGVCLQWFESTICHRRSSMVSSRASV